jgi:hypothetical protein
MVIDLGELAAAISKLVLRFVMRRATAAAWTSANPVLTSGEPGYETDTKKLKIGDGVTPWATLTYFAGGGGGGTAYPWPDGCIAWFGTAKRAGVSGKPVHYLNAPQDSPARGLVASVSAGTPLYSASGGVAGDGTSYFTWAPALLLKDTTILAVVRTPAAMAAGRISSVVCGSTSSSLQLRLKMVSTSLELGLVKTGVIDIGVDTAAGALPLNTLMVIGATLSSAGAWQLLRGLTVSASGTTSTGNLPSVADSLIGNSPNPSETALHDLHELVIFDRVLGSTDLAQAINYLKSEYGI